MSEQGNDKADRGNKPVETLRDGALKVSIFRNQSEKGAFYAVDPGRIYTDEASGDVRETSSLSGSEPLRMAHLLTKGYERVGELRRHDKEQARDAQTTKGTTKERVRDDERDR